MILLGKTSKAISTYFFILK